MFTITTYNIMFGLHQNEVRKSLGRIVKLAKNVGEQYFIGLQEVRNTERNLHVKRLITSVFKQAHVDYFLREEMSSHDLGLALISGDKPRRTLRLELPKLRNPAWLAFLKVMGWEAQFGALLSRYRLDGRSVSVAVLHLDTFGGNKHRARQAEVIKEALDQLDSEHDIVMGDFNIRDVVLMSKFFGADYSLLGNQKEHTVGVREVVNPVVPGMRLLQRVAIAADFDITFRPDWILTKNLKLVSEGVEYRCLGSDHYPAWAVLDFES